MVNKKMEESAYINKGGKDLEDDYEEDGWTGLKQRCRLVGNRR